jgi:hypothetical protein
MRAAILVLSGPPIEKQQRACLAYIEQQRWEITQVIPYWASRDAVRLVREGFVDVVVAATNRPEVRQLAADIGDRGQVVYVHPQPTVVPVQRRAPSTMIELVVRWFRRGRTPHEIAIDIDSSTREVKDILRRSGENLD